MENKEILNHVDHTLLKAVATWDEIKVICEDGLKYNTASVCIPASFVKRAHEAYPELNVCTVIGFPLGYSTKETKLFETEDALRNGANEIDMVVNLGDVKEGKYDVITDEIATLKKACGDKVLKVIVETCYLTDEEKVALCKCVTDAKANYIKTSTGFGTGGAEVNDIELFAKNIGPDVKIKASGGIRTREDMEALMNAGADRLGCSAAVKVLG